MRTRHGQNQVKVVSHYTRIGDAHDYSRDPSMPSPFDIVPLFQGRDSRMFHSKEMFHQAGFEVLHPKSHNIMVGRHPAAPGYLFKKYNNAVSSRKQGENYERRADGSRRIRKLIEDSQLKHILVPRKWPCTLPGTFTSRHILVVEEMDVLSTAETQERYRAIDHAVLRELCLVLFKFSGIDSAPHNIRFTRSGQIAFIDTEDWNATRKRDVLRYIAEHLSSHSRGQARKMLDALGQGASI